MLATLTFGGLRISELPRLRWRDVDLAIGWLTVAQSKTDAGVRKIKIRGALRDELLAVRSQIESADGLVFPTSTGRRMSAENFRNRVLAAAVRRADENLTKADLAPLPEGLTPHSLRRTFASLLYAVGESPRTVMKEMGHEDEGLALRLYAQTIEGEQDKLRGLTEGANWANTGERGEVPTCETKERQAA
jgi:integrase